jgi:hypothetical protein
MRASGVSGAVRWGYHEAAVLGPWVIEPQGRAFSLRASVRERNEAWLAQAPLDVALRLGPVEWVWGGVALAWDGSDLVLGLDRRPDEVRDVPLGGP